MRIMKMNILWMNMFSMHRIRMQFFISKILYQKYNVLSKNGATLDFLSNFLSNELILEKVEKPILCHFLDSIDCALPGPPEPELLAHGGSVFWLTGIVLPMPCNLQHRSSKCCSKTASKPPTLLLTMIMTSARVFSCP